MADKKTIDKVKELLETNAYAPLKEAAEKWLAVADEKYGDKFDELKEKGEEAFEKLGDLADKYSDFALDANEKLKDVSDKVSAKADELSEKAGPALDELMEKAAPALDKLKEKTDPAKEKLAENELVKQLKEAISTFSENIELFGSEKGAEIVGSKEAAEQIRKHAEAMKAEGKTYCDCPACTKAREILKELGEDIGE